MVLFGAILKEGAFSDGSYLYKSAGLQVLAQSVTTTPCPTEAFIPKVFGTGAQNIMSQLLKENKGCIKLFGLLCSWNFLINQFIQ